MLLLSIERLQVILHLNGEVVKLTVLTRIYVNSICVI
nr:MAG TPA: hypothetical protein [Bacteriophage sp.]